MIKVKYPVIIIAILSIIILIGLYFFTHDKIIWYLKLLKDLSAGFCGALLAFIITYFFLEKNNNLSSNIITQKHGVRITNKGNNIEVNQNEKLEGDYNHIRENQIIRVYILNDQKSEAWLGGKVILNSTKKTWESSLNIGNAKSKGQKNNILVTIENLATKRWEEHYRVISNETNEWKPFKYPFDDRSVMEVQNIEVTRK